MKIGIAGLGTVGASAARVLQEQEELLSDRAGRRLELSAVSARDRNRDRGVNLDGVRWFDDPVDMARSGDLDVIVELVGGSDGIARAVSETALQSGKHLVTANKALLAVHGNSLARLAEASGVGLGYEAAVAGAIPIIDVLQEGLSANPFRAIYGILNGTCNYILSRMRSDGLEFSDVVSDAQRLGYAEADPSVDVDGTDTAHKLALLTALGFGCHVDFSGVYVEGIRNVTQLDIRFAEELGFRIKLLGITRRDGDEVEQRVHPCLVPISAAIANVDGATNAVVAEGAYSGSIVLEGAGAGGAPTASAVVSDLVRLARNAARPVFGSPSERLETLKPRDMTRHRGDYYIRLMVLDRPGVIADVAAILRDEDVSMRSMLQHGRAPGEKVPIVLTTHETIEANMMRALHRIDGLDPVLEPSRMIRIEAL